jgi:oxalate decarboxylase/phosphoglucose isomerase-like protein (cupin superfamily)
VPSTNRSNEQISNMTGKIPARYPGNALWSSIVKEPFIASKELHDGIGELTRHSVLNFQSRQSTTVQIWNLYPGSSEGMHVHAGVDCDLPSVGNLEEVYIALSGKGAITLLDSMALEIGPGDSVCVPANVWHGVECRGSQNFYVLVLWAAEEANLAHLKYLHGRHISVDALLGTK